jgi:uncharacterized protein (TIGR01777 family)
VKIVIAGGSGFLGRALARALLADRHDVVALSRAGARPPSAGADRASPLRTVEWTPDGSAGPWRREIDGAGAVINLAGESIAARRWTAAQKRRIRESRVYATRSLTAAIRHAPMPPPLLLSGSAVGYYGPRGDEIVTEDTPAGGDFLADVAKAWEAEAASASSQRTRVAFIRTGIVLDRRQGALPKMLPPFWFFVGGPVGGGMQYWPWIHRQDWIDLVRWMIATGIEGPINATAPHPVTNADFARALGRALRRPALISTPAFALRAVLGEMADALLLSGQRAVPATAQRLGFTFRYPRVEDALRDLF